MSEAGANSVRGPKLNDPVVIERRAGTLGVVPGFLLGFVGFIKVSFIKLS